MAWRDALDALALVSYCCCPMLMTHVDLIKKLIKKLLNYNCEFLVYQLSSHKCLLSYILILIEKLLELGYYNGFMFSTELLSQIFLTSFLSQSQEIEVDDSDKTGDCKSCSYTWGVHTDKGFWQSLQPWSRMRTTICDYPVGY